MTSPEPAASLGVEKRRSEGKSVFDIKTRWEIQTICSHMQMTVAQYCHRYSKIQQMTVAFDISCRLRPWPTVRSPNWKAHVLELGGREEPLSISLGKNTRYIHEFNPCSVPIQPLFCSPPCPSQDWTLAVLQS